MRAHWRDKSSGFSIVVVKGSAKVVNNWCAEKVGWIGEVKQIGCQDKLGEIGMMDKTGRSHIEHTHKFLSFASLNSNVLPMWQFILFPYKSVEYEDFLQHM